MIDRTGSMCDTKDTNGCIDLNNAKDGVHTLLSMLSPPYAQVGMIAFPPLVGAATPVCNSPPGTSTDYTAYDSTDRRYVDDTIGSDYRNSDGTPNPSSGLYLHTTLGDATKCVIADGYTSYSEALRQAKAELDAHGRANVPDVIVFLTDGEANIGSVYASDGHSYQDKVGAGIYGTAAFPDNSAYPPGNADDQQPCHTAENLATAYKAAGVTIYSIGYALGNEHAVHRPAATGRGSRRRPRSRRAARSRRSRSRRTGATVTAPPRSSSAARPTSRTRSACTRPTRPTRARRSTRTTPSRTSHRPARSTTSRRPAT